MSEHYKNKITVLFDYQIFINQKRGGVSRYHYEIAKRFRNNSDINCILAVLFPRNVFLQGSVDKKIYLSKTSRLVNIFYTYLICKIKKVDIIHPTWYSDYLLKLKFSTKCKLVITIHDMIQEIFPKDFPAEIIKNKKKYIYAADKIIAVSNNTKKDILNIYPDIDPDKIEVVYESAFSSNKKQIVKELPDNYILYIGSRSSKHKNFRFFIKGVKDFVKRNHIFIVCVGAMAFTRDEIEFLKGMGVYGLTKQYTLNDSQLNYVYANARCLVYPSLYEGFGLPVLEAMVNDCPCVVSNSSSLPEVAGEAAVYFDPTDANDLCQKIEQVLYDDVLRDNLIVNGRKRAKMFSWEKTAQELERIYKQLKTV